MTMSNSARDVAASLLYNEVYYSTHERTKALRATQYVRPAITSYNPRAANLADKLTVNEMGLLWEHYLDTKEHKVNSF